MVMYTGKEKTIEAVNRLRQAFTAVRISNMEETLFVRVRMGRPHDF
jgi:hypothetical protein